jgi:hypothetical protein
VRIALAVTTIVTGLWWAAPARAGGKALSQGFKVLEQGGELFVKLDKPAQAPAVKETPTGLELVIPRTRMVLPFRRLDTRCFQTAVRAVVSKRRGRDLVVSIELKDKVPPPAPQVKEGDDHVLVSLFFPAGKPEEPLRPVVAATAEVDTAPDYSQVDFGPLQARRAAGMEKNVGGRSTAAVSSGRCSRQACEKLPPGEYDKCISDCMAKEREGMADRQKKIEADREKQLQDRAASGDPGANRWICLNQCLPFRQKGDEKGYESCTNTCFQKYPSQKTID